ncbi:Origin recognition complex, subunit 1 [Microbotryomycetes sp. JL201]|nr:Origin recognition complex, subunit 1 [Microbotryomycetes sp. JL201]
MLVDRWVQDSLVKQPGPDSTTSTASSSPSKRVSRRNGLSNETDYRAFERVDVQQPRQGDNNNSEVEDEDQDDWQLTVNKFQVGDTVIVDKSFMPNQKWLHTPDYLARKSSPSKGKRRVHPRQEHENGWIHEDGLGTDGNKVGVITRLFQDVRGHMMAQIRWFARPGALWGIEGPPDGEELQPYELYYTADSTFLHEARERAAWRPGQPPPPSLGSKTPLCTDTISASSIKQHVQILSAQDEWPDQPRVGQIPFLVRRVYDAKPVRHAEFLGDIDWIEVYERGRRQGDWDIEPTWSEQMPVDMSRSVKTPTKPHGQNRSVYVDESDGDNSSASSDEESEDDFEHSTRFNHPVCESDSESGSDLDESDDGRTSGEEHADSEIDCDDELQTDDEQCQTAYPTPTKSRKRHRHRSFGNGRKHNKTKSRKKRHASPAVIEFIRPTVSAASRKRVAEAAARRKRFHQKRAEAKGSVNAVPPAFMSDETFQRLPPFKQAQALLHVSATPEFLPCREQQREHISLLLSDAILGQYGTCLYIHGVPGTGKTATVHSVVRELQNEPDIGDFQFVEINGMKISEPQTAYCVLWEAISGSGHRVTPRQALTQLENHFQTPSPSRKTTVVLVDELDQMITKKQDVVYNFFNWPHIPHSRLIVLAVANTMDLPERELSGKIRSRLGTDRIVFQPYNWQQLQEIVCSRLGNLRDETFEPKAIDLIAKRVAGSAGDARKALDVARRTLEKVDQVNNANADPSTKRICSVMDASQTYKEMSDFGANSFLQGTSLVERVLLLSVVQCTKRAGMPEVTVDDVLSHAHRFMTNASLSSLSGFQPSSSTMMTLLRSMHSQRLIAVDSGASAGTQSGERDLFGWCKLGVSIGEVWDVLRDDHELSEHVPKV